MVPGVALRPLTVADAEVMSHVLADPTLYEFTGSGPASVEELKRRYAIQTAAILPTAPKRINLVVVLEPGYTPIGYVQATLPRGQGYAEIAWVIGRKWQGKGYATRAVRLLVEHLEQRGVQALVAHIHPCHDASQAIARSLGMHRTDTVVDGEQRWQRCLENNKPLPAN